MFLALGGCIDLPPLTPWQKCGTRVRYCTYILFGKDVHHPPCPLLLKQGIFKSTQTPDPYRYPKLPPHGLIHGLGEGLRGWECGERAGAGGVSTVRPP